ncbi:MAG: hypothetical protein CXT77_04515 [uncultured DHVE6 group euryarchaeote]|jgi:hypothetical protein|nr:MAG: hypothetical protein CXT77_04515 [uncultured DHVE6 group euryarchaeote]
MKTKRIRIKINEYLCERPRNTAEILEHINTTMRHGTTSQQLGNVLSKDKHVIKIGFVKKSGILSGGYDICEWATSDWVRENMPEENSNEIIYGNKTYLLPFESLKRIRNLQENSLDNIV